MRRDEECVYGRHSRAYRDIPCKVARWDPDKRWLLAMQTVRVLKDQGWKPLLVARGGLEAHGAEVLAEAAACGLRVVERTSPRPGIRTLLQVLDDVHEDYAVPGQNALVLETTDPWEFVGLFGELHANPARERALRQAGLATAQRFAWSHIVQQLLLPRLHLLAHTKKWAPGSSKATPPGVSMQVSMPEAQPTGQTILAAGMNSGHRVP